jgi:small subunit ribosomal protein S2
MSNVSMKSLLESGVHFGHRTQKWDPRMKPYIFTERNHIHIIDLQKTVKALDEAYDLVSTKVSEGGTVLFVGTKRQAQDTIQLEATRCKMPWVTARWLGGTMTNWITIRQRINELEKLERMRDQGDFALLTKKEALGLERKIDRLDMLLGGIREMVGVPDLLFVVDVRREYTAVHEANLLEIPVVAMVDTNCNPEVIDYIIPSNDDAIRAIKLIVGKMADAVLEGQAMRKDIDEEMPSESAAAFDIDTELTDEDLFGDATLAKLEVQRVIDEAEAAELEIVQAEGEETESIPAEEESPQTETPAEVLVEEVAEVVVEEAAEVVEEEAVEVVAEEVIEEVVEEVIEEVVEEVIEEVVEEVIEEEAAEETKKDEAE